MNIYGLLRNSKGSAGMLAIMTMLFLGIIGGAYATLSASNVTSAARTRDAVAAQYLAEAGSQWALAYLPSHLADVPNDGTKLTLPAVTRNSGTPTAGSYTITFQKSQEDSSKIIITSTGRVNTSAVRSVVLTVKATSGGGGNNTPNSAVFKYGSFSQKDMTLNNKAKIIGNVRTNSSLNINATTVNVQGKAYYTILGSNTIANKATVNDNIDNGDDLVQNTDTVTLDVDKLMQNIPSLTKSGTDLKALIQNNAYSGKTYTLSTGSYYANYGYSGYNCNYYIPANQKVTLYIDGYFELNNNHIIGESGSEITIYSKGVNFAGDSYIQTPLDGKVKLYSDGYTQLNQTSNINSGDVIIIVNGGINFATTSAINNKLPKSIFRLYLPNGGMEFNNNSSFANAGVGMVVATGNLHPNSDAFAPSTVFITNGDIACDNTSIIGGAYANGKLNINTSASISYSSAVMETLNLLAKDSLPVLSVQTRNDHE